MKIAVTGKGGVGKTTFAAGLIKYFALKGKSVFAIDADPDANLALTLYPPDRDEGANRGKNWCKTWYKSTLF